MPPDDSKLARLLPGIAARGAETHESAKKYARQETAASLPSAYDAEQKGRVGWWSVSCLLLSFLLGAVAFALSCTPQRPVTPRGTWSAATSAGSPLRFWEDLPSDVLQNPHGDPVQVAPFFVNALIWLAAALS